MPCESRKHWHNSGDREYNCDDLVESREHEHDSGDRECDGDYPESMSMILVTGNVMVTIL